MAARCFPVFFKSGKGCEFESRHSRVAVVLFSFFLQFLSSERLSEKFQAVNDFDACMIMYQGRLADRHT